MLASTNALLEVRAFMPHGFCLQWNPGLLWTHVGSDAVIAASYVYIPVALAVFVWRRDNLQFKNLFYLFAAFILLCGGTHVLAAINVWWPAYVLTGGVKAATAVVSVLAALALLPVLRRASRFIDDKMRLNAELIRNRDRLRGLLDNIPSAVIVHRPDTSIEYANPLAQKLIDQPDHELLGTLASDPRWHFLRDDGTRMPVEEYPVNRILRERVPFRNFTVGVDDSETTRWMQVNGFPEMDGDGNLVRAIISFVDITERRDMESRLHHQANTDYLTGLANRRSFMLQAARELARARRYGHALSLLMLDLDHFKQLNDRHGHVAGDDALRGVADVCRQALRQNDIASRLGGEEFAIALPEADVTEAAEAAERLREALERTQIEITPDTVVSVTASIGVAELCGDDKDIQCLLNRADAALYRAKAQGRNCIARAS